MCILTISDIKTFLPLDISSYMKQVQQENIKAVKLMNLINEQKGNDEPTEQPQEEPTEQPQEESTEHPQPPNNDSSTDITHKTKLLNKFKVSMFGVCDKSQIIKDCKNNNITFEEAYKKIKQIQRNEQKQDNITNIRRIKNISF